MEPRIQYVKTKDGVNIAYYTLGEGMPLVHMPAIPASHLQMEWQWSKARSWAERLADRRKLVRYDGRGTGLSDRDVTEYSLDAHMLDLEAVADGLDLERFALFAILDAGPVAIAYAARHPERVSHLILWCSYARTSDYMGTPEAQAEFALRDKDWTLFTEMLAHVMVGWSAGGEAGRAAGLLREAVTQEAFRAIWDEVWQFDVASLLPDVRSPTIVLHRSQAPYLNPNTAKELASQIPEARLALFEGTSMAPFIDDVEAVKNAIDEVLGQAGKVVAHAFEPSAFRTVLFTDVEGSTALTQRLGDAKARELLREHERMVRVALKTHGGSEVKTMGDGFMASFSSATRALECAIAMQQAFAAHNELAEEPIRVRAGLNAGEPIAEDEDLYGTAVNLAARIAAKAEAGEILASDVVRQLVAGKEFLFSDRGETELRGFEDPVRLFELRWRQEA